MPRIEIDFETFKEITRRRSSEAVTEGEVVRDALGLGRNGTGVGLPCWESEGVRFPIGEFLEHKFRDGRLERARVTSAGIEVNGKVYPGLSPAAVAVTGHQVNGWLFWYLRDATGRLVVANTLREAQTDR